MILGQVGNLLGNALLLILLIAILLFEFLGEDKRKSRSSRAQRPLISVFQDASREVQAYVAVTIATLIGMLFNVFQVNQILPGTAVKTFTQSLPFFLAGGLMALGVLLLQQPIIVLAELEAGKAQL